MNQEVKKINVNDFEVVREPNMKSKITEVENYFKNRMLNSDFEVREITEYKMFINVDNYVFIIWIGNLNLDLTVRIYEGSFMMLDFSIEDKKDLQDIMVKIVDAHKKETAMKQIEEKQKEIEELKKAL